MATPKKPGAKRGRPKAERAGRRINVYATPALLDELAKVDPSPHVAAAKVLKRTLLQTTD